MYKADFRFLEDIMISDEELQAFEILDRSDDQWIVKYKDKIHTIKFEQFDMNTKSYKLAVDDELLSLKLKSKLDLLIDELGMENAAEELIPIIEAPMPGLVVDIRVKVDDEIEAGTPLLVLEAMKMENIIKAKAPAKVKEIHIKKADKVDKGQILIEFYE